MATRGAWIEKALFHLQMSTESNSDQQIWIIHTLMHEFVRSRLDATLPNRANACLKSIKILLGPLPSLCAQVESV